MPDHLGFTEAAGLTVVGEMAEASRGDRAQQWPSQTFFFNFSESVLQRPSDLS